MKRFTSWLLILMCLLFPTPAGADDSTVYEGNGTVLQRDGALPGLCLGALLDTLPPQCWRTPIPLEGWSWEAVAGEARSNGTTYGKFHLQGTYDGITFEVWAAGPAEPPETLDQERICPRPPGGWEWTDRGKSDRLHLRSAVEYAESRSAFAGAWVRYLGGPRSDRVMLGVALVAEPSRFEAPIRRRFGGPLCLKEASHTDDELKQIRKSLVSPGGLAEQLGLQVLESWDNVPRNLVLVHLIIYTESQRADLESVYGPEVVRVSSALQPVE